MTGRLRLHRHRRNDGGRRRKSPETLSRKIPKPFQNIELEAQLRRLGGRRRRRRRRQKAFFSAAPTTHLETFRNVQK